MNDVLQRLYAAKARSLVLEREREPLEPLRRRAAERRHERRPFATVIAAAKGPAIVAEIKRASPSVGLIARDFDPEAIATIYESAGVDAISVLTEADHFLGDLSYLDLARANSTRPILRKDFLSTPYQIVQSAAHGADVILLIVAGLDDAMLAELSECARSYDLETLVEIHDEEELERALRVEPSVIGINNRDLRTFTVDLGVTEHLMPKIPSGTLVISESGVQRPEDIARLHAQGVRGFLIGESLMRAEDPAEMIRRCAVEGCLSRPDPRQVLRDDRRGAGGRRARRRRDRGHPRAKPPRRVTLADARVGSCAALPPLVTLVTVVVDPEPDALVDALLAARLARAAVQRRRVRRVLCRLVRADRYVKVVHFVAGDGRFTRCQPPKRRWPDAAAHVRHALASGRRIGACVPLGARRAARARPSDRRLRWPSRPRMSAAAVRAVRPFAVDVRSGVETSERERPGEDAARSCAVRQTEEGSSLAAT